MAVASVPITHGRHSMLRSVAALNGRVFDTDPVIAYMLLGMSQQQRLAYLPTYWTTLIKSALLNRAVITEADGWKSASVVIPPGGYIDNVWTLLWAGFLGVLWKMGLAGVKRLWFEFSGMIDNAKRKGLRGQSRYYYVFSLGTEHEHRGKGLAKAIMRDHQQTAQAANLPIWLEATTAGSRALYLSMGFEEVEEIRLGKGKVAADASLQSGGPGVSLWAMVSFCLSICVSLAYVCIQALTLTINKPSYLYLCIIPFWAICFILCYLTPANSVQTNEQLC